MKTMQAEYNTDIARLAEDIAKRDTEYKEDMARRDGEYKADAARRETKLILAVATMIGLAVAILKLTP